MRIDREISPAGEVVSIYWCDKCGRNSGYSDYRWPGHQHWEENNYTLCYECLVELSNSQAGSNKTADENQPKSPGETPGH